MSETVSGVELRSRVEADATLTITLETVEHEKPIGDEILVRMAAAPVNPSDLVLVLGPADLETMRATADGLVFDIPASRMSAQANRIGQSLVVGNEGAGIVEAAGPDAQQLIGRKVALTGGGMYASLRKISATQAIELPDEVSPADGASATINPMTALAMVETARMGGHQAIVHTAAASNLGQMLNRVCIEDGIGLVNIVRSAAQAKILRDAGARYVVDSSAADFSEQLDAALSATGAVLAFDAIGGGDLAAQILVGMEAVASRGAAFSRYGSAVHKQVYIYGRLNPAPIAVTGSIGMAWGIGGFLLSSFLAQAGPERATAMRRRVMAGLRTTFASSYAGTVSLTDLLEPDTLRKLTRRATGEKYLVDPSLRDPA
ncbi:MAG: NADH oxidase [Sphingomonas sp.]|uniref:alcohol dehydrogenase catalytic domain-containing protein n=1 Tax=Sphingomonas sp. TaxID=28214 RepID=UPI001AC734E7|nr:NADH oxidase [Sphingomonas sp.]MBN8808445.1 NADH oxidase [Sphingomonas sp.]